MLLTLYGKVMSSKFYSWTIILKMTLIWISGETIVIINNNLNNIIVHVLKINAKLDSQRKNNNCYHCYINDNYNYYYLYLVYYFDSYV